MFKRIVLIGAAGVGKTTLVNVLLESELQGYELLPEMAKFLCEERAYASIYDIPNVDQFRFDVLNRQMELESKSAKFIADRSVIDSWVYFDYWSSSNVDEAKAKEFLEQAQKHAKIYDQIIFVPKTFPTPEDGFRWANEEYQYEIEAKIKETLEDWGLKSRVSLLKAKSIEDRIKELKSLI